ncbi:MAG: hypothetical protein AB7G48_11000 [Nitrospiraceae bacterium]
MKRFHVVGLFHQALAKHAKQLADVEANKLSTALRLAVAQMEKREGIRKVKHKVVRFTVIISNKHAPENPPLPNL